MAKLLRLSEYRYEDVLIDGYLYFVNDGGAETLELLRGGADGGVGGAEVAHQVDQPHRLRVRQWVPVHAHHLCWVELSRWNYKLSSGKAKEESR